MIALEVGCQNDIGLIDRADTAVDDLDNHFFIGQLQKALLYCLYGTLNISLDDNIQLFKIACLNLGEQIIQRHS